MKTPIPYQGGKQRIAGKILELIPPHSIYVEPFAGGASLLFYKTRKALTNSDYYREVINDMDSRLTTFYRVAQTRQNELINMIRGTAYSRELHNKAQAINKAEGVDELTRAWAVYTELNQGFGHGWNSGWGFGKKSRNLGATWANATKLNTLLAQFNRLKGVFIENLNALEVIKTWDSENTFFYCDPPYPGTEQKYKHRYTIDDLNELIQTLECSEGSCILSGYDADDIIFNHPNWQMIELGTYQHSGNTSNNRDNGRDRQRTEFVWLLDRAKRY